MHKLVQKPKTTQQTMPAKSPITARSFFGQSREVSSILHLQRTIGNQAVLRLLQFKQETHDANSTDNIVSTWSDYNFNRIPVHTNPNSKLQAKLKVNVPGDKYEQHADAVAACVMQGRSVIDLLKPYTGKQSAMQTVQMAPQMSMQPPVKLDLNFRMFFKRYFMEFLVTFPDYADENKLLLEKKLDPQVRKSLMKFMTNPPKTPVKQMRTKLNRRRYPNTYWHWWRELRALLRWLKTNPCPIISTSLSTAQKIHIAGSMLIKSGVKGSDCGDWVTLVRGYAGIGGYEYLGKTNWKKKGVHIESHWETKSPAFGNIAAGDWLQITASFYPKGHSVIFNHWVNMSGTRWWKANVMEANAPSGAPGRIREYWLCVNARHQGRGKNKCARRIKKILKPKLKKNLYQSNRRKLPPTQKLRGKP